MSFSSGPPISPSRCRLHEPIPTNVPFAAVKPPLRSQRLRVDPVLKEVAQPASPPVRPPHRLSGLFPPSTSAFPNPDRGDSYLITCPPAAFSVLLAWRRIKFLTCCLVRCIPTAMAVFQAVPYNFSANSLFSGIVLIVTEGIFAALVFSPACEALVLLPVYTSSGFSS